MTRGCTFVEMSEESEVPQLDDNNSRGTAENGNKVRPDGGTTGGVEAPPDDEEMPITEHIEEMFLRLVVVALSATIVTLAIVPLTDDVIIQMWYDIHDGTVEACQDVGGDLAGCTPPHIYGPLEFLITRLKLAAIAGLVIAFPIAIYQIYRFMRPGLYPHERRYYLASVPLSFVLGVIGVLFAYFVVLPLLFTYFITYTEGTGAIEIAFQLQDTMNLIIIMMGMLAVIFQIPLAIVLAIMMGITTRRWLENRRLYFYMGFASVAFLFGPDPTGMAPLMLAVTMIILFEGTLLLLRWTGTN